ncbi:MAG: type III-B CRISPR-associated protein Cas10/Cmr2 [Myxococcales bacterium]|nr:type III-B CRISPR-associated protein Cas10/Cmr2 [Myxococcales bacterium]
MRKSALDGVRETVLDDAAFGREGESADALYRAFHVAKNERLCGVGLLKRVGSMSADDGAPVERFFSTAHLAALTFMRGAQDEADAFAAYRAALVDTLGGGRERRLDDVLQVAPRALLVDGKRWCFGHADGGIFFEGALDEIAEEHGASAADADDAKRALRKYLRSVGRQPREPLPYHAVLLADGDRMGACIDAMGDWQAHKALSNELADFARQAQDIVETHDGALIYSGGDDVLAFVPLGRALDCAAALRDAFTRAAQGFAIDDARRPTLSVGVGVSHYKQPMGEALELARRAEALAKVERDSLAVIVDKRGGAPVELAGPWSASAGEATLFERLASFVTLHCEDRVPDRMAFQLEQVESLRAGDAPAGMDEVVRADVERLFARKQPRGAQGGRLDEDVRRKLEGALAEPGRLGRELIVARLFADAAVQSGRATPREPGAAQAPTQAQTRAQERTVQT